MTSEERQKCRLSIQLLLETTLALVSCSLPLSPPLLRSLLPFVAVVLHWLVSHLEHIPIDQITQLPSLWTGLSGIINQLYLKSGFEAGIDTTQRLSEETALIAFITNQEIASTTALPCANEHLCLAKIILHIKTIIREKMFGVLSLSTQHGIYQLAYTPPPDSCTAISIEQDPITSPTLSPLFSSPILNNSLFPSIWSDTPLQQDVLQQDVLQQDVLQQDVPQLTMPTVASADTIKSLWNASDALSQ